jgi:NCS1 family nucleobase:cation symporter-1
VPPEDRHGKVRDLFTLWFGGNIAPLPIVTGALGVQLFHLNLVWGIVAILVGHLVGVLMALHSAQGPDGHPADDPEPRPVRPLGALLVVVIAGVMYIGFFASNIVLAGKSLHGVVDSVPVPVGIVIGALGSGIIGIIGYRFIHVLNRIGTWVLGIGIVVGFGYIFTHVQSDDFLTRGGFNLWLAGHRVAGGAVADRLRYVSDYSRYLPADVKVARPSGPPTWARRFEPVVHLRRRGRAGDPGRHGHHGRGQAGHRYPRPDDAGAVPAQRDQPQRPQPVWRGAVDHHPGADLRLPLDPHRQEPCRAVADRAVACCVVAVFASADFIGHFVDMVLVLLVVLVPWTAINLIDFYAIHKGDYDIQSIFQVDGGIYGRYNPQALLAYAVGIAVQIPFMNTPLYVGDFGTSTGRTCRGWWAGGDLAAVLVAGQP